MRIPLMAALLLMSSILLAQDFKKEYADDPVCVIKTSMGEIYLELFAKEAPLTVQNFIDLAEGHKTNKNAETGKTIEISRHYYDSLIFHRVIKNFMIQGGCPKGDGTGDPGYKFQDEINANCLGLDKLSALDFKTGRCHPFLSIRSTEDYQRIILVPLIISMGGKYKDLLNPKRDAKYSKEEIEKMGQDVGKKLQTLTVKECYENLGYHYSELFQSHAPKKGVIAMANSGPNTNGSQFFINLIDTPWLTGKHTVFGKVIAGMDVVEKIGEMPVGRNSKPLKDIQIITVRLYQEK